MILDLKLTLWTFCGAQSRVVYLENPVRDVTGQHITNLPFLLRTCRLRRIQSDSERPVLDPTASARRVSEDHQIELPRAALPHLPISLKRGRS